MAKNKIIPLIALNGGFDHAVLTFKEEWEEWKDGKLTDVILGVRLGLALQGDRMSTLTLNVKGTDPIPRVSDEQIGEACASMKFIFVKLSPAVKVKLYGRDKEIGMSVETTADNVSLAQVKQPPAE